jgi:hypothetical protein
MFDFLAPVFAAIKSFFMFFRPVLDFIISTKVPEQIQNIEYKELFTNPWFLIPFLAMLGWNFYKKAVNELIIILLLTGAWAFCGTDYMQDVLGREEIALDAVLPLVAGACTILGIIVYLFFLKDD